MGRHSSGKNNYSLSAGALSAVAVAIVAVAALVWFLVARPGSDGEEAAAPECVSGELSLPVSATDDDVARQLIDDYASASPVVRDYCVTPTLVSSPAEAAVHIAPNTPVTQQELARENRTASVSDPAPVAQREAGVAGAAVPGTREEVQLAAVAFPVDEEPAASAVVAAALAGDDESAVKALSGQRIARVADIAGDRARYAATLEDSVPEGLGFTGLGSYVVYSAIPLNQGGPVTEDQARAGQDFARAAAEKFSGEVADQPTISETVWAAATPSGGTAETAPSETAERAAAPMTDTLFLLDTSAAMAPYLPAAADGIGASARAVAADGHRIGLWNYSSPLSPGVTKAYRENVALTPNADEVATASGRFLTDGQPQTREALAAALAYAGEVGGDVRVVLITTGTADGGDDEAFAASLRNAAARGIQVDVVHVGEGQEDPAVTAAARSNANAADAAALPAAIRTAAGTRS
ncbi:hypothetical protein [Corynebacterium senegalense]|uniref:hypothetical protein n=1 Tax=Corynebacterium senegalense TaxID=2080750 RepID=UPI000E207D11|nr:hypothetical protein [Corynebacterium senegalense]